jgi:uncharacterized protein GlcG (DUF336 family)
MTDLTLAAARSMIDRAVARAEDLDVRIAVAVVDASGHLVASARMDGASFVTPQIALGKAWTAAAYGIPSGAVAENMAAAPAFAAGLAAAMPGSFMPRQGAVPLGTGGGIGVSGATSAQDEDIAQHGAAER